MKKVSLHYVFNLNCRIYSKDFGTYKLNILHKRAVLAYSVFQQLPLPEVGKYVYFSLNLSIILYEEGTYLKQMENSVKILSPFFTYLPVRKTFHPNPMQIC